MDARVLERTSIPSPKGNTLWVKPTVKGILCDDPYRALDREQMQALVEEGRLSALVLSRLDPDARYGIWWFNQAHKTQKRVAVETPNGREYKTSSKTVVRPRSEWIAVPVPDCGIPPALVEAAREAVKGNRSPSSAGACSTCREARDGRLSPSLLLSALATSIQEVTPRAVADFRQAREDIRVTAFLPRADPREPAGAVACGPRAFGEGDER